MNRILVVLTIHTHDLPSNFPQIIEKEREHVAQWKQAGFLEHLYLRPTRNGAVFIFKELDQAQVEALMTELPLYPFRSSLEILPLIKDASI
jgi:muconolactone D-isomerase